MNSLHVKEVGQLPIIAGGFIFNSPEFQSLKRGKSRYFVLFDQERPIARICFWINNDQAISGHQATFGSIDAESPLSEEKAKYFIEQVINTLRIDRLDEVILRHWPAAYATSDGFHKSFLALGFLLVGSEVNQHLVVTKDDFYQIVNKNQHSKIRQTHNRGYYFKALSINELPDVYQLISKTLTRKGYSVSMTYEYLFKTISLMPTKYLLFGLFDKSKLISATVSVCISQEILYNFYHADDSSYRTSSPLVRLIQEIYIYCQQNGIGILDLGISSENGLINPGLFNFKKNLGCASSEKNTYRWRYD